MNRLAKLIVLLMASSPMLAQTSAGAGCPEYVVPEKQAAKARPALRRAFERISVFNRDPQGREYELAPDLESKRGRRITQTWNIRDYRDMAVFVRCRYRGTDQVVDFDVPPGIQRCRLSFELDKKQNFVGPSAMHCR